jgi:diguanylate cyclase (GGDEF)-like protein/PAS domain S-box-containing protein
MYREVLLIRLITLPALACAVFMFDVQHRIIGLVVVASAIVQLPLLARQLRHRGALPPMYALHDIVGLSVVCLLEPALMLPIITLIVATLAYSATAFGRAVAWRMATIATCFMVAGVLVNRPPNGAGILVVYGVAVCAVVVACSQSSITNESIRRAVTDVLESTDTVVWEATGDQQDPSFVYGPIERMYGWPVEHHSESGYWAERLHPDDAHLAEIAETELAAGRNHMLRYRFRTASGEYRWVEDHTTAVVDESGRVIGSRGTSRDVTDKVEAELLAARYMEFVHSLPLGVAVLELRDLADPTSFVVVGANAAIDRLGTQPLSNQVGRRLIDVRPEAFVAPGSGPSVAQLAASVVRRPRSVAVEDVEVATSEGAERIVSMRVTPLPGNHVALVVEDVTVLTRARRSLEFQAYHDLVTGLPNRSRFRMSVEAWLEDEATERVVVALLDLDQFKEVNDAFGHDRGDDLLAAVGKALQGCAPEGGLTARLGGDEFAVAVRNGDVSAAALGESIVAAFTRPLQLVGGMMLQASVSVGAAEWPVHAETVETLLQRADVAMYVAKRQNRGSVVYSTELDRSSARRVILMADLRRALDAGELTLHYQPIVHLETGLVTRVEALLRWEHPELGLLLPGEFIELTEFNNMNRPVVLAVARQALEALRRWRALGHEVGVSINVGGHSLADQALVDDVIQLVRNADVPPMSFGIELTERQLLLDTTTSMASFHRLSDAGIWISIDDFGTGASSLWALRQIPARELKIDRSFVEDLRRGDGTLIRSIVALAHDLALQVVAEGVEDEVTYRWLREHGCDHVQGFLLARPMPDWQVELLFGSPLRPSRPLRSASSGGMF